MRRRISDATGATGRAPWRRVAVVIALALVALLLLGGSARAANRWTDIGDAAWKHTYRLSAAKVAAIGKGYRDGTFRPGAPVTRAQFAKLAVFAFRLKTTNPAAPTFSDVSRRNFYYRWIEGGVAAGILPKRSTYRPLAPTTRQQASAIVAAYLVRKEMSLNGAINGRVRAYPSLASWYKAEGDAVLRYFKDRKKIGQADRAAIAYLVFHHVLEGIAKDGYLYLDPGVILTRAQAVALIVRVQQVELKPPASRSPKVTGVAPVEGRAGGGQVVIVGSGFRGASSVSFGPNRVAKGGFTIDSDSQITVKAVPAGRGTVNVRVTTASGTSPAAAVSKYRYLTALPAGHKVVKGAISYLGVPYAWAGASPNGFDCSGLVMYVFGKLGVRLPHSSLLQSRAGSSVALDEILPGDLLFFQKPVSHVGIYVGRGLMIDATRSGYGVRIEKARTSDLVSARRIFPVR